MRYATHLDRESCRRRAPLQPLAPRCALRVQRPSRSPTVRSPSTRPSTNNTNEWQLRASTPSPSPSPSQSISSPTRSVSPPNPRQALHSKLRTIQMHTKALISVCGHRGVEPTDRGSVWNSGNKRAVGRLTSTESRGCSDASLTHCLMCATPLCTICTQNGHCNATTAVW
jgi:hypothetical protein